MADNPWRRRGIETHVELNPHRPTFVNYITAVAEIPERFDRVESIEPAVDDDAVEIRSSNGEIIRSAIDLKFLKLGHAPNKGDGAHY